MAICLYSTLAFNLQAGEVDDLITKAMRANPRVKAARFRVEQYLHRHDELLDFTDPTLYLAAGHADHSRSLPVGTGYKSLSNNSTEAQIGVELPLEPGAYLSLGASNRWIDNATDQDPYSETKLGARLRIPLLQDRGFQQWSLERARALGEYHNILSALMLVMQDLRQEVELAYINHQAAKASLAVSKEATARFEKLLSEARELVRLKVTPEYQIAPAEMELELRNAADVSAEVLIETTFIALRKSVGFEIEPTKDMPPKSLVAWASKSKMPKATGLEESLASRAEFRQITAQIEVARSDFASSDEELKPDLSLNIGLSWQGEHEYLPVGSQHISSDQHAGGEITLVYQRPLGFSGERARRARFQARIAELKERLEIVRIDVRAELENSEKQYLRDAKRLAILIRAQDAAIRTLNAENERFRLGEGRSRNVLDAQKDLTSVNQQLTQTAAALLRTRSNFMRATGYQMIKQ